MQRVFTKNVGRYKAGNVKDFPLHIWRGIEKSTKQSMESFSKSLEEGFKSKRKG